MKTQMLTEEQARQRGLKKLTQPYRKSELDMMRRVITTLQAGNIDNAVVQSEDGPEVWRSGIGILKDD